LVLILIKCGHCDICRRYLRNLKTIKIVKSTWFGNLKIQDQDICYYCRNTPILYVDCDGLVRMNKVKETTESDLNKKEN